MAAAERVRRQLRSGGRRGRVLGCGPGAWRIVDLIAGLVAKSILTMRTEAPPWALPAVGDATRLYGAQQLAEAGEDVKLARRSAGWYAELISGGDRPWWAAGPRQAEMFQTLDIEWANVEAALDFCAGSPPDVEPGSSPWSPICGFIGQCAVAIEPAADASTLSWGRSWPSRRHPLSQRELWPRWRWGYLSLLTADFAGSLARLSKRYGWSASRPEQSESTRMRCAGSDRFMLSLGEIEPAIWTCLSSVDLADSPGWTTLTCRPGIRELLPRDGDCDNRPACRGKAAGLRRGLDAERASRGQAALMAC